MPLSFPDHNAPHAVAVGIHCTAQRIEQHRQVLDLVQHQALTLTGIELKPGVFGKKGAGGGSLQIKIGVNTESARRETGGPGDSGVRTQAAVHTLQFKTNSLKMNCIWRVWLVPADDRGNGPRPTCTQIHG